MDIIYALKIIISKSPRASEEAIRTIAAARNHSPIVQVRYSNVLIMAMSDPDAQFTPDERAILAEVIETPEPVNRDFTLRVRLTDQERAELQRLADIDGIGMSEYVRRKLYGG